MQNFPFISTDGQTLWQTCKQKALSICMLRTMRAGWRIQKLTQVWMHACQSADANYLEADEMSSEMGSKIFQSVKWKGTIIHSTCEHLNFEALNTNITVASIRYQHYLNLQMSTLPLSVWPRKRWTLSLNNWGASGGMVKTSTWFYARHIPVQYIMLNILRHRIHFCKTNMTNEALKFHCRDSGGMYFNLCQIVTGEIEKLT